MAASFMFLPNGVKIEGPAPQAAALAATSISDEGDLMVDRSKHYSSHAVCEGVSVAKTIANYFEELRGTRVWRSVFRSGTGSSTLHRALAIQQNVFLHLFSTKVRTRMLSFSATWYLGTLTFGTFLILVATGIPADVLLPSLGAAGLCRHQGSCSL
jgi:hypothetical protein